MVLCEDPEAMLSLAQKQWRKLSRMLQRRRAFATNAVEILKYTYTITQMQHASFTAGQIYDHPEANVYFEQPELPAGLPADCLSVYLVSSMPTADISRLISRLPDMCLLVDYTGRITAPGNGLKLRSELEKHVRESWSGVNAMLTAQLIDIKQLVDPLTSSKAIDDAVDAMLGVDVEFLAVAKHFQHQLDLARPLRSTPKALRDQYEAFIVLAHRVQTFSAGGFSPQFLRTYANDTFFLNDRTRPQETFAEALRRHEQAGRANIVRAMVLMAGGQEPKESMRTMAPTAFARMG